MKLSRDQANSCKSIKEKTESIDGPIKFDNTYDTKWRKALMNQFGKYTWCK